jgi:hypothetical protein
MALFLDAAHPCHAALGLLFNQALGEPKLTLPGAKSHCEQGHPPTETHFKGHIMNLPKQMESLFLIALGLLGAGYGFTQFAHASVGSPSAAPTSIRPVARALAVSQFTTPMQVVIITGKRMTALEKAAYDAQHEAVIMQASN